MLLGRDAGGDHDGAPTMPDGGCAIVSERVAIIAADLAAVEAENVSLGAQRDTAMRQVAASTKRPVHVEPESVPPERGKVEPMTDARPLERCCGYCEYYLSETGDETIGHGKCYRYAPAPALVPVGERHLSDDDHWAAWPTVGAVDFCGEYKRRVDPRESPTAPSETSTA